MKLAMVSLITLESYVQQNPKILSSEIDDETVLLSIEKSHYYGLNPIATRIWKLLTHNAKVKDVLEILLVEFEVSQEALKEDLLSFLHTLAKEELIVYNNERE